MRSHARAVVIGGGIVGCSVLYHLVKLGYSDAVLLEKADLTHGSTWHAAGLLPLFNMSYAVGQLHKYSVELYRRLEAETGQAVSFHQTGNLRLATNQERMDEYRKYCGTANTIGVPFEMIGPDEIAAKWPLCETAGLVGALFHPDDGHVAPADVTQALAIGARAGGAEINRNTEVVAIAQGRSGEWALKTTGGNITTEVVVSATGAWAREVGAMVGLDVPMVPVEHQYLVTEEVPELRERKAAGPRGASGAARIGRVLLHPRGARGADPGALREGRAGVGRRGRATRIRPGTVGARYRPPATVPRGRDRARADARPRRHQGMYQRAHSLHPRRQSADRPGPWAP